MYTRCNIFAEVLINMKKISIIIPAYNEEARIGATLQAYSAFFDELKQKALLDYEIVVVLNGCVDNTLNIVCTEQEKFGNIVILDLQSIAGKGAAIKAGFLNALQRPNDYIGFVDADMATLPQYFYALVQNLGNCDGAIASRYIQGAQVYPPRPWIKRFGSWLVYESLITLLFGLRYKDYQCGAKLFTRRVITLVAPQLTIKQWAFDVELLYLCKKFGFNVCEVPTVWYDREGSKLRISSGWRMLAQLVALRWRG